MSGDESRPDSPRGRLFADGRQVTPDELVRLLGMYGEIEVTAWRSPVYPATAAEAGLIGTIVVQFTPSERAEVTGLAIGGGPERLRSAAKAAAGSWRFQFREGSRPRPLAVAVPFTFEEDHGAYYASIGWRDDPALYPRLPAPLNTLESHADGAEGNAGRGVWPAGRGPSIPETRPVAVPVRIVTFPQPRFTELALRNHTTGTVKLAVLFRADGEIKNATVLEGLPDGLNAKAIEAVRAFTFEPACDENGAPVDHWKVINVSFAMR
jgi:TonB family protein